MNTLLSDEEISQAKADYANGTFDAGYKSEHFKQRSWGEAVICKAQDAHARTLLAEAVKKIKELPPGGEYHYSIHDTSLHCYKNYKTWKEAVLEVIENAE